MQILVNGASREVRAADLSGALEELGYGGARGRDGRQRRVRGGGRARQAARLADGDRIEVLAPMQGG